MQKPRVVDLTDAGPGVGITNNDVCYGIAQEILITNSDYYIRHHLAPGDSSHNEVEPIQSYVGKRFVNILLTISKLAYCLQLSTVDTRMQFDIQLNFVPGRYSHIEKDIALSVQTIQIRNNVP